MGDNSKRFKGTYFISSMGLISAICEFGITSIFTLFLLYVLHFSTPLASHTFAYYYGFAYTIPMIIGYVSDTYFKKTTSLILGLSLSIVSQIFLFFAALLYTPGNIEYNSILPNMQNSLYFIGMTILAIGASFTNLTIPYFINSINENDFRVNAFSIFYSFSTMGVLIGVILMNIIAGTQYYLCKWGFLTFLICLIIGLIVFILFKDKYLIDYNGNPINDEPPRKAIKHQARKFFLNIYPQNSHPIYDMKFTKKLKIIFKTMDLHEKDRLIVFFIFLVMFIIFRISYTQTSISLVFFIDNFVQRDLGFYEIPVNFFSILNPLYVLIFSPVFLKITDKLKKRNIDFRFTNRIIIGLIFMALCYAILVIHGYKLDMGMHEKISFVWILLWYLLISLSELSVAVALFSMVGDLTPKLYYSLFFGIFTATKALSMFLSGLISSLFPTNINQIFYFNNLPFNGLMSFFLIFLVINLISIVFLIIFRNYIKIKIHLEDFN